MSPVEILVRTGLAFNISRPGIDIRCSDDAAISAAGRRQVAAGANRSVMSLLIVRNRNTQAVAEEAQVLPLILPRFAVPLDAWLPSAALSAMMRASTQIAQCSIIGETKHSAITVRLLRLSIEKRSLKVFQSIGDNGIFQKSSSKAPLALYLG